MMFFMNIYQFIFCYENIFFSRFIYFFTFFVLIYFLFPFFLVIFDNCVAHYDLFHVFLSAVWFLAGSGSGSPFISTTLSSTGPQQEVSSACFLPADVH